MVAMLLARSCVSLIPAPLGADSREDLVMALARVPRYGELMDRFSWAKPLFARHIATSHIGGADALADVHATWARIEHEDAWSPLRAWMRWSLAEEPEAFLDAICADVLRGGPDPGICVPVAAGVDRFAQRFGLVVARSHPTSLAQRAETAFARSIVSWSMPVLMQADACRILHARELLESELQGLRLALECAAAGHGSRDDVRDAARLYNARFAELEAELLADEDDEVRPVTGTVALSLVAMPQDVALRSSADAAAAVSSARERKSRSTQSFETLTHDQTLSLLVKVMGRDGVKGRAGRAWARG